MIKINGISKKFQNENVINYKDYIFENGKKYILLGASGCGKSTLLNIISGILSPTSGEVKIDDFAMSEESQKQKDLYRIKHIGYIFQDFKLIDEMTVIDNINILKLENIDTSLANDLLVNLEMDKKKKKKIKHLSGGEKQRIAIVRALCKKPDIILADEPTGNLNFSIGEKVIEKLVEMSKEKTLIVVTHDDRLVKYFDVVINMDDFTSLTKEEN